MANTHSCTVELIAGGIALQFNVDTWQTVQFSTYLADVIFIFALMAVLSENRSLRG
jgi:hypothetical protein